MTLARGGTPNKFTFIAKGTMNGSLGNYELTIKLFEHLVTHWLFRGFK